MVIGCVILVLLCILALPYRERYSILGAELGILLDNDQLFRNNHKAIYLIGRHRCNARKVGIAGN